MSDRFRQVILGLNAKAQSSGLVKAVKTLTNAALTTKNLASDIVAIGKLKDRANAEWSTWLRPDDIAKQKSGPFDACDLQCWLQIADAACVPAVPAVKILQLTEEQMAQASGAIQIPERARKRLSNKLYNALKDIDGSEPLHEAPSTPNVDESLGERLYAAMDAVPEGWMVRHARIGASTLKALAGSGFLTNIAPEVRFGPDLEIGPGWIRNGNRRRIDTSDARIVTAAAQTADGVDSVFLARPWVTASRWTVTDDPNRQGTVFAGKGAWPAEWRVFVENGIVVGVSYYYAWAGAGGAEDVRMAIEAARKAEEIVHYMKDLKLAPRFLDIELARDATNDTVRSEAARFSPDSISCTLDFIETNNGLLLLEAGPPYTKIGGGHPCGFAGMERPQGVALGVYPGVDLSDPKTWFDRGIKEPSAPIYSWDQAHELAASDTLDSDKGVDDAIFNSFKIS